MPDERRAAAARLVRRGRCATASLILKINRVVQTKSGLVVFPVTSLIIELTFLPCSRINGSSPLASFRYQFAARRAAVFLPVFAEGSCPRRLSHRVRRVCCVSRCAGSTVFICCGKYTLFKTDMRCRRDLTRMSSDSVTSVSGSSLKRSLGFRLSKSMVFLYEAGLQAARRRISIRRRYEAVRSGEASPIGSVLEP